MCVVGKSILVVGVTDKEDVLRELPVRVLAMDTGVQAIRCLREERIGTIISHWELIDMPAGKLLRSIIEAKPFILTIAFIRPGDTDQEIAARRLGVDAVLSEDRSEEHTSELQSH